MTGRTYCLPGTAWATSELAWEQGFAALSSFVHDYGEASVPASFKTPDGFNLGTWVAAQRREKDSMPEARKSRLEALEGWMWSADEFRWESGFAALESYVVEHGDARVPVGFTAPNGFTLGIWVSTQRGRKELMPAERKQRLEAIEGWVWSVRND